MGKPKTRITKKNNCLWACRKKMGLTQKEAARRMGASQTSDLSRYEHGVKFPSLINALKLEIVYRTPVAFLFEDLYQELKEEIRKQEENAKCEDDQK